MEGGGGETRREREEDEEEEGLMSERKDGEGNRWEKI